MEQILGRVLRQPYVKRQNDSVLNISYVLTCSADFRSTLDSVVKGLNGAGFSSKDYRIGSMVGMENPPDSLADMVNHAEEREKEYIHDSKELEESGLKGGELGDMLHQYKMKTEFRDEMETIKLPKFVIVTGASLFNGAEKTAVTKDAFLEGFSLEHEDAHVAFSNTPDNMYTVDLSETGEAVPQYKMTNRYVRAAFRESLEAMPDKQMLQACINSIASAISCYDNVKDSDVRQYLKRVFGGLTED